MAQPHLVALALKRCQCGSFTASPIFAESMQPSASMKDT